MIRYAVIEDEQFTRQRLIQTVNNLRSEAVLAFECAKVKDAIRLLKENSDLDLIFMDVELADGNCFQIFDAVSPGVPIIFTTAFDQFAFKAFQSFGIGYIVKPYTDEEIAEAIEKYENIRGHSTDTSAVELTSIYDRLASESRRYSRRILITSGDTFDYLNLDDIVAFEMEDGLIFAIQKDGKRRLTNFQTVQAVLAGVPTEEFFQVARGLILNISCITKVSKFFRGRLVVKYRIADKEKEVTVSSTRRDTFLGWLGNS